MVARMRAMSKPVIAMVNGHAHGAGFNLALGCDLRVIADEATLAIPFSRRGIGPLVAGRIFDLTNSYAAAFDLCIAINMLGAIAALGCTYAPESAPLSAITEPASA